MKKEVIIGIYMITSPSGKIYIGRSVNIYYRWNRYKKYQYVNQSKLFGSFKKYGVENHVFKIVEICKEEDLNSREIYWIDFYDTLNPEKGLNLAAGGKMGKVSQEVKDKISKANKNKPKSESHCLNLSLAHKDVRLSKEHCKAIGEGGRKRWANMTKEQKEEYNKKKALTRKINEEIKKKEGPWSRILRKIEKENKKNIS